MPRFHERLVPPPSWWLGALVFAGAWAWLVLVVAGAAPAMMTAAVLGAVCAAALWAYGGAVVIEVADDGLRAGRATLSPGHVGAVEVLDTAAMRQWHGPLADARAWLVHRAYVGGGVKIDVDDASDPTPYWLVSSRRPQDLKTALDGGTDGQA